MSASQQAQRQRRYEAVNRRRQKRNVDEQRIEIEEEKIDEPAESSEILFDECKHISLEKYEALEADNCARISDLAAMKEKCLSGRGFPSKSLLKDDN